MGLASPELAVASANRTASGVSAAVDLGAATMGPASSNLNILVSVSAVSGVTPALDLSVEWSQDGGTTWAIAEAADSVNQITAAKVVAKQFALKAPLYRVRWAIAGTTPSFTFSVRHFVTG